MIISADLWVVQILIPSLKNTVVIDNFDFHIFQFNIDFVIFGNFLRSNSHPL